MLRILIIIGLLLAMPAAAAAAEPGILYAADARTATIVENGKVLRLSVPAATPTTWFTDRPVRRAGSTTLAGLVDVWDASGFREDPPNAALLVTDKGETRTHIVSLRDPEHAHGRVSFRIVPIPRGVEAGHQHAHTIQAGRYGRAELFIDDAAYPPCSGFVRSVPFTCSAKFDQMITIATNAILTVCTTGSAEYVGYSAEIRFTASQGYIDVPKCPSWSKPVAVAFSLDRAFPMFRAFEPGLVIRVVELP